jgi:hypothetical protein
VRRRGVISREEIVLVRGTWSEDITKMGRCLVDEVDVW